LRDHSGRIKGDLSSHRMSCQKNFIELKMIHAAFDECGIIGITVCKSLWFFTPAISRQVNCDNGKMLCQMRHDGLECIAGRYEAMNQYNRWLLVNRIRTVDIRVHESHVLGCKWICRRDGLTPFIVQQQRLIPIVYQTFTQKGFKTL